MKMIDYFAEVIAYTLYLIKIVDETNPNYDEISDSYLKLISESRNTISNDTSLSGDWERSLFAICAWVDEKVLLSNWQEKDLWQINPLQKQFFKTTQAGEKFYEVYEQFSLEQDAQVIEVFNYCIQLGFQGKNFNLNTKNQIISDNNFLNNDVQFNDVDLIFPDAYKHKLSSSSRKSTGIGLTTILIVTSIIAILGLGAVNMMYRTLLDEQLATGYSK